MMAFDFGWSGQSSTTRFQGLSSGKTSSAARIASASGVSNITGLSIFGITALRMRSTRAGSPDTTGFFGSCDSATPAESRARTRNRMGTSRMRKRWHADDADEDRIEEDQKRLS